MNRLLIDIGNSAIVIVLASADGEIKDTHCQRHITIDPYLQLKGIHKATSCE